MNNIPKEKNHYNNSLESFAIIDNNLAAANRAIGESSNLAQIALTYTYNFSDQKYTDYVCILSVCAQCSIDNAKRKFDIDLPAEIKRIKQDMDIEKNKLPKFWFILKRKDKFSGKKNGKTKDKANKRKIEQTGNLVCPMNYIYDLRFNSKRSDEETIPMNDFFVKFKMEEDRKKGKKIEKLIEKYSLDIYDKNINKEYSENYFLLLDDFETLVRDIQNTCISNRQIGLMSWLIDRAFIITPKVNRRDLESNISKNRPLLMKTLYSVNKDAFLKCFSKNVLKSMDNADLSSTSSKI